LHGWDVGLEHRLEGFERGPADRRVGGNAGIGEHNVELAEFCGRLRDGSFGRRDIGRVGHDGERVRAQFFCGGFQRRLIAAGDGDLCPLRHEQPRRGEPNTTIAACDQRCLAREPHDVLLSG